jgi:hypothetical protein
MLHGEIGSGKVVNFMNGTKEEQLFQSYFLTDYFVTTFRLIVIKCGSFGKRCIGMILNLVPQNFTFSLIQCVSPI